jgi:hypothetical protein
MDNKTKVKTAALRIAFLMPHQEVNPDLIEEAYHLLSKDIDLDKVNRECPEYMVGAMEALTLLITMLRGKGPHIG